MKEIIFWATIGIAIGFGISKNMNEKNLQEAQNKIALSEAKNEQLQLSVNRLTQENEQLQLQLSTQAKANEVKQQIENAKKQIHEASKHAIKQTPYERDYGELSCITEAKGNIDCTDK